MANIMQQLRLRNKPKRSGFDLTKSVKETAKIGEATPCGMWFSIPDDTHQFSLDAFTRTVNINTAASARMREYYDYYFIPFEVLWNKWDSVITQMKDNVMHAMGPIYEDNTPLSLNLPYFTSEQVAEYIQKMVTLEAEDGVGLNYFGYKRADLTVRLLAYLGYGDFSIYLTKSWSDCPMAINRRLSPFPLLAYQKVYYDHIRFQQREKSNPSCFNLDYIKGTNDLNLDITNADFMKDYNFFDLRYFNYNKDLYFGLLPSAQYGEPAVAIATGDLSSAGASMFFDSAPVEGENTDVAINLPISANSTAGVDILKLRMAEASQRWKEVTQSVDQDYKSQIEAHFGISVSDYLSHKSTWINGFYGSLDINPVVNQNLTGDNGTDLKAYGTIGTKGGFTFQAKDRYGIILCLYHAAPIFDYCCGNTDPMCHVSHATDFPLPEFDQIGMEAVYSADLCNFPKPKSDDPDKTLKERLWTWANKDNILGYAPRYIRWKTDVDVALGGFAGTEQSWVLPFTWKQLYEALGGMSGGFAGTLPDDLPYYFFKINPTVADTIFATAASDGYDSDQLRLFIQHNHQVTRSLDYNGLPM